MEDLIGKIGCGSKLDSVMVRILRSAMEKAREKLQFKDRPIEFLHEQTTFYELAAILVEGSLKIVENEAKILETSCSKIISDLIETRERLVGRIREMKGLITEKDREYRERLENEARLREALEVTERESIHLYEMIGPGLMKMKDSVDEEVLNIKKKLEDEKMILDSEIRARTRGSSPNLIPSFLEDEEMILIIQSRARRSLSSPSLSSDSLDKERRVRKSRSNPNLSSSSLNVEKRARSSRSSSPNLSPDSLNKERGLVMLEGEKMILNTKRRARKSCASSPNLNPVPLKKERGLVLLENDEFMSSSIDVLRQNLDLVFGRMQLKEVLPLEKQWRKGIKREVESILVKGFAHDLQAKFDIEIKKRDGLVKESWFDFIDEMKSLFHELRDFFSRNDVSNVQPSLPKSRRTNSEPNLDIDFTQNLLENDGGGQVGGSHHVWKIIKSHESIIQNQREKRSSLAREGLSSWTKRNEDINAMERLIQDAITRLDNFTQRKHKVSYLKGVGCRNRAQEKRRKIPKPHRRIDRASTTIQSFEGEIKKLQEERDGLCFQISVIEDTYRLLFCGVMKDFSCCGAKEVASDEPDGLDTCIEIAIREDIFVLIFQEIVKQLKISQLDLIRGLKVLQEDFRRSPILKDYAESLLREDIYKVYFKETAGAWRLEALKHFGFEVLTPQSRVTFEEEIDNKWTLSQFDSARGPKVPQEDFRCSPFLQDYTESLLREEIYKIYFKETAGAWRLEALKHFGFEVLTPQSRVTFQEEIDNKWNLSQFDSARGPKVPQEDFLCSPFLQDYTESLLREEIHKIYFKETIESWRLEARTPQSRATPQEAFFRPSPISQDYAESLLREETTGQSNPARVPKTPQEDFHCSPAQDCTERLLREQIYKTYLTEMTKSWRPQDPPKPMDLEPRTLQSRSRGGDGESSLIQKLDSLLKSLELEEDLMLTASSLIKEHSVSNSLVILDCEETEERAAIEWLITDDEGTFCSVSDNLERALQQLHTSKELLAELEESLEASHRGGEYYESSQFNSILRRQDESAGCELDLEDVGEMDWSENVLAVIKRFRFLVDDVEVELQENLDDKCLRLEALKGQVDALTQPMAWINTRKLLYEKAFISRCRNLKLAEAEVDLLGDQVETLLSLLERVYIVLSRDARVLSRYFEVHDILKLIKIELNGARSSKPKS